MGVNVKVAPWDVEANGVKRDILLLVQKRHAELVDEVVLLEPVHKVRLC